MSKSNNEIFYYNFVNEFIKFRLKTDSIDSDKNIIILSNLKKDDGNQITTVFFINPELLFRTEYNNVYEISKYKMIISNENLKVDFPKAKYFENVKYEDFNRAKFPYSYTFKFWSITLNDKMEIIDIAPFEQKKEIKEILQKHNFKFSN